MRSKPDVWMPLYIGDYLGDTGHLDAERHGCYLLWMMHYWRKGPLPDALDDLIAIGKLRGPDAPSIAQALLKEFFTMNGDGCWHQKRVDAEKEAWNAKQQKAQEKAEKAANTRWKKNAPSIPPSNAPSNAPSIQQAMHEQCPSPSPISTRASLSSESPKTGASPLSAPPTSENPFDEEGAPADKPEPPRLTPRGPGGLEAFAEAWNSHCRHLPKIRDLLETRRKKVSARIRQGITLDRFLEAIACCTSKPFLRGDGPNGWMASFDWLIENDRNIERAITEPWGGGNGAVKTKKLEILSGPINAPYGARPS